MKRFFKKLFKPLLALICVLIVITVIASGVINPSSESNNQDKAAVEQNQVTVDKNGYVVSGGKNSDTKTSPSPSDSSISTEKPTATPTPSPEPTPEPSATPEPAEVNLMMVGDDLVHDSVIDSGKNSNGTYNFDHLFTNILGDIKKADLAVINQETVLGGDEFKYTGYPRFNSPQEIGDSIVKAGFNVVLHATNHAMDKGEQGMQNSLDYWKKQKGITVLGANDTEEEYNTVKVVEVNGIKIAMLNYTYSLNGLPLPKKRQYMVNLLDEDKIREDVAKAKEQADFVIVFPHWGTEYVYETSNSQKRWTKLFLETGVDLVIGTHPHVIEPVEWIEGEDGHKMLVYYSLGNYVSGQDEVPRMLGGMAKVTIERDATGKVAISKASITPLVTQFERDYGNLEVLKLSDYTDSLAAKHRIRGMSVSKLEKLASQVLGDWYQ